jgi:hypothetical protein
MSPNAVRMAQLGSGNAPVLNTHRSSDARDVLGRVIAARLEGGRGHARLQFSAAADVELLWQRIAGAELRHAHRIGRHVQFLGNAAEGRDKIARPRAGGPDDLNRACGTIHGRGCGDRAPRGDRLPIRGKSIGQNGINRRGIAPARIGRFGHGVFLDRED